MGGMVSGQAKQDLASLLHRRNQIFLRVFILIIVHDASGLSSACRTFVLHIKTLSRLRLDVKKKLRCFIFSPEVPEGSGDLLRSESEQGYK
jgi:hypothetical protein